MGGRRVVPDTAELHRKIRGEAAYGATQLTINKNKRQKEDSYEGNENDKNL